MKKPRHNKNQPLTLQQIECLRLRYESFLTTKEIARLKNRTARCIENHFLGASIRLGVNCREHLHRAYVAYTKNSA